MEPERWEKVRQVVEETMDLPEDRRIERIREACGDDTELFNEVQELITATADMGSFLEQAPELPSLESLRDASAEPSLPFRKLGNYFLIREIGRGASGVVYLAHEGSEDGRLVALKVLNQTAESGLRRERFLKEIVALQDLRHEGILPVYFVDKHNDPPYFVTQFINGRDLATEIEYASSNWPENGNRRLFTQPGTPSPQLVAEIISKVARALGYAHKKGIIHRDIKPQNILLDGELEPYLVDFGLAKDLGKMQSITLQGDIQGTPSYMSPEQTYGDTRSVDQRSDIFSLGLVLYELLTLHKPFGQQRDILKLFHQIRSESPPDIAVHNASVPKDLAVICSKAIEKQPEDRYATANEFADDLNRFLNHVAVRARPISPPHRFWRKLVRHKWASILSAVGVVAIVAAWLTMSTVLSNQKLGTLLEPIQTQLDSGDRSISAIYKMLRDLDEVEASLGKPLPRGWRNTKALLESDLEREIRLKHDEVQSLIEDFKAKQGLEPSDLERSGDFGELVLRARRREANLADLNQVTRRLMTGLTELAEVSAVTEGELQDAFGLTWATLRLDISPPEQARGARVVARTINSVTGELGEPTPIGIWPMEELTLPNGLYRIIVEKPDYGFCEITRNLSSPGGQYRASARLRPEAEVVENMILVEGQSYPLEIELEADEQNQPRIFRQTHILPSYYIDEYPVTNREYGEFVRETGYPQPRFWPTREVSEEWADLPVTMISVFDAQAYAEWAGKRLVTLAEWELAARSPKKFRFPWGNDASDLLDAANLGLPGSLTSDMSELFRWYVGNVREVTSPPAGTESLSGMKWPIGNVWEWTQTPAFGILHGELRNLQGYYLTGIGCDFPHMMPIQDMGLDFKIWVPADQRGPTYGFRCARSVEP